VLILADPGAGKTFEALSRARKIRERGKKSFFIRIETIDTTFENAFEIGTGDELSELVRAALSRPSRDRPRSRDEGVDLGARA
jgi:hypothetical protein